MSQLLHATCVAIEGCAVLLTGPSGSGKSDLALRLIDRGATLVGDDAVVLDGGSVSGPERLRGQIEVRGVGIVCVRCTAASVPLALHIDLVPREAVPRLPDAERGPYGCAYIKLHAFDHSAAFKVEAALAHSMPVQNVAQL